ADHADLRPRVEGQGHVVEDELVVVRLAHPLHLVDELGHVAPARRWSDPIGAPGCRLGPFGAARGQRRQPAGEGVAGPRPPGGGGLAWPAPSGGAMHRLLGAVDWEREEEAAVELLRALIRFDTSNPPGN